MNLLDCKPHESGNTSNILTMQPQQLAVVKLQFYKEKRNTFSPVVGPKSLKLHSLLQVEQTSVQNPQQRGSDLEANQINMLLTDDYWSGTFN